jgi:hypothetical protein
LTPVGHAFIMGNYLDQQNYNNGRGITGVDNPGWIKNTVIRNCAPTDLRRETGVVIRDNEAASPEQWHGHLQWQHLLDVAHGLSTTQPQGHIGDHQ